MLLSICLRELAWHLQCSITSERVLNETDGYDSVRQRISSIYDESKGRYGYRRICYVLRGEGIEINHKTVLKLMRQLGISATRKSVTIAPIKVKWVK